MSRLRSSTPSNDEKPIDDPTIVYDDIESKYNHSQAGSIFGNFGQLNESNLLEGAIDLFKLIIQTIYSILPFFIIFYLYTIYQTTDESFYYPDFPNSLSESSVESLNDIGVEFYDLADYKSTGTGWQNEERVLFLVPLRDASAHLPLFFSHMKNLTYPHNLIDLAFLISDTSDSTIPDLKKNLKEIQADSDKSMRFGRIDIYEKNFGQIVGQSFSDRHGFAAQGPRRKLMAIARNWLLTTALKPDHSWVYWRDADVETVPATILEDLMHHDKDVIVPNIWRPLPDWLGSEQAYDLNSWQESEGGIELAEQLDEDAVIVEGYPEYATWRPHLAYLRDPYGDEEVEVELDGIGGVSILAKGNVFRQGAIFPAFSFKKHAETEAFGKLCKTMGFDVIGLPHYVIWHIYEPSTDDLKHMEWLANEELRQLEYEKNKVVYNKLWKSAFEDVSEQWREEKFNVFKNTDLTALKIGSVDWDEVDEYLAEVDEMEEIFDSDKPDYESFLINLDQKNKKLEESILQSLQSGPVKFGQNKHEMLFGNYYKMEGAKHKTQMKFKKFVMSKEEEELRNKIKEVEEQTEDNIVHEVYDADLDKVIVDDEHKLNSESDEFIGDLMSDKVITKDKQLFNDMEIKKMDKDGEEGEVEFKEQKPIKKVKKALKAKQRGGTRPQVKEDDEDEEIITKTIFEIDDHGKTTNTVYRWGKPTETPESKKTETDTETEIINDKLDDSENRDSKLKVKKTEPKQGIEDESIQQDGKAGGKVSKKASPPKDNSKQRAKLAEPVEEEIEAKGRQPNEGNVQKKKAKGGQSNEGNVHEKKAKGGQSNEGNVHEKKAKGGQPNEDNVQEKKAKVHRKPVNQDLDGKLDDKPDEPEVAKIKIHEGI